MIKAVVLCSISGLMMLSPIQAEGKAKEMADDDAKAWYDNIKVGGDFRLRHEEIKDDSKAAGQEKRGRSRFRARLKLSAKVSEVSNFVLQLASGSDDPVSTNETFDSGFSSKGIRIDLTYLESLWTENLTFVGGKMYMPFQTPGKSELIWDGDLNPEGAAVKAKWKNVFATVGGFWVEERSSSADTSLVGLQGGFDLKPGSTNLKIGLSYYDYGAVRGRAFIYDSASSFGNSADLAGTKYKWDYELLNAFIDWSVKLGNMPASVFFDWVDNGDPQADHTGWLAGFTLNKAIAKGTWDFRYSFRELEKDAVLGVFTDADFSGGGTNGEGSKFNLGYMMTSKMKFDLTHFINTRGLTNGKDYQRTQFDVSFKI